MPVEVCLEYYVSYSKHEPERVRYDKKMALPTRPVTGDLFTHGIAHSAIGRTGFRNGEFFALLSNTRSDARAVEEPQLLADGWVLHPDSPPLEPTPSV